ncbi:MAG: flippase-like domain-containing protein [Candidatus Riflebacteria bacterium]|nr:flippase-like domain-containing protein [Candidatus Riflebacteria bacterium]
MNHIISHWKKYFGFLISALFLWLALRKVEWDKIPPLIAQAKLGLLYLPIISFTCEHVFRAFRWNSILRGRNIPFYSLYSGIVFCYFFNNILPARAGEIIRSYHLGKGGIISTSEAFGSVFLERFLDGLFVISILAYLIFSFKLPGVIEKAIFSAVIFYAGIFVFMALLQYKKPAVDRFFHFFLKPLPEKLQERIIRIEDSFVKGFALIKYPGPFLNSIIWTYISWAFSLFTIWLQLKIWSIPLEMPQLFLFVGILSIGAMIPSSPGMIGIYQYCCVLALTDIIGLEKEKAVAFSLASHIFSYFYVLFVGVILMFYENISFRELSKEAEQEPVEEPL